MCNQNKITLTWQAITPACIMTLNNPYKVNNSVPFCLRNNFTATHIFTKCSSPVVLKPFCLMWPSFELQKSVCICLYKI